MSAQQRPAECTPGRRPPEARRTHLSSIQGQHGWRMVPIPPAALRNLLICGSWYKGQGTLQDLASIEEEFALDLA